MTVFIVIAAEDWNAVWYLYVRALGFDSSSGRTVATAYFLLLFIFGNIIMLAMFTALLLKSQDKDIDQLNKQLKKKVKSEGLKKLSTASFSEDGKMSGEEQNPC